MKKLQDIARQSPEHLRDILTPRVKGSARIEGSSFFRIPAVSKFIITTKDENQILKGSGLDRKMPPIVDHKINAEVNRLNHYLKFKIKSMQKAIDNNNMDEYGKLVEGEMKHSTAFRLSAFNTVLRGGYKDIPLHRIYQILNGVNIILKQNYTALKYFRVEIPKGSPEEILNFFAENPGKAWPGKMRPLGVPTAPGRVVLHMGNGFLTLMLSDELKSFNHAFMPNVGTNTALSQFANDIPQAKYVYEFDIRQFFPTVNIVEVLKFLAARGVPFKTIRRLFYILINIPKNMSFFDDNLSDSDLNLTSRPGLKSGLDRTLTIFQESYIQNSFNIEKFELEAEEYFGFSINGSRVYKALQNLPQGAAPSTILALVVLADGAKDLMKEGIKVLMYADDGLLYSMNPFTPKPPEGFEFAEEKSGGVKSEGCIKAVEVKFLGLKYNQVTKLFKGSTRTGSTLEFGPDQIEMIKFISKSLLHKYDDLMKALVQSGIGGLVLSKLYGGKFGKLDQEIKRTYIEDSYGNKYHKTINLLSKDTKLQRIASTISCEGLAKQIEKSKGRRGKAWLKSELRKGRSSERLRIQLQDLRNAMILEDSLDSNNYYLDIKDK